MLLTTEVKIYLRIFGYPGREEVEAFPSITEPEMYLALRLSNCALGKNKPTSVYWAHYWVIFERGEEDSTVKYFSPPQWRVMRH